MINSTENDITFYLGGLLNVTMKPSDYIVIVSWIPFA